MLNLIAAILLSVQPSPQPPPRLFTPLQIISSGNPTSAVAIVDPRNVFGKVGGCANP